MKALLLAVLVVGTAFANGDTYPTLKTLKGVEFRNVRVSEIEPDGITVFHAGGVAKIPFRELPEELRKKYGFDAKRAAQAEVADAQEQARIAAQAQLDAKRARITQLIKDINHSEAVREFERKQIAASGLSGKSSLDQTPEEKRAQDERKSEYLARKQELKQLQEEIDIITGKTRAR